MTAHMLPTRHRFNPVPAAIAIAAGMVVAAAIVTAPTSRPVVTVRLQAPAAEVAPSTTLGSPGENLAVAPADPAPQTAAPDTVPATTPPKAAPAEKVAGASPTSTTSPGWGPCAGPNPPKRCG